MKKEIDYNKLSEETKRVMEKIMYYKMHGTYFRYGG